MADKVTVAIPHSEFGPSAADRWINCPGSVLLIRGMDDPESWYAAEGTAAHTLSEWCREQRKPAEHWRGATIVVGKHEFVIDQEMIDSVNTFVEYAEQWPGDGVYEERVYYDEYVPGGFGTTDDGRLLDYLTRVTDLKHGKGVQVWAKDNFQLRLYALGLYLKYRHLYHFRRFVLAVVQPRLDHVDEDEIDLDTLLEWAESVVKPTAQLALQPGAPLKAGDHCTFCPARRVCKVRAEYVMSAALGDMPDLDAPVRDAVLLTNEEVGLALPKLPQLKKFCADLEAHALSEIAKGNRIPHPVTGDYKIVEGRSVRVFDRSEEEVEATLALDVEDPSALYRRKLKPLGELEKIVGKAALAAVLHKPKGKPKLAPGTDKREALVVDPSTEFTALEDE